MPSSYWRYRAHKTRSDLQWLEQFYGEGKPPEIKTAVFLFVRRPDGRLIPQALALFVDLELETFLNVFISLRQSPTVSHNDKRDILREQKKLHRVVPPVGENGMAHFIRLKHPWEARELNAFFQTPEGAAYYHRVFQEVEFEYFDPELIRERIRSGQITIQ
ncbi:MAG: hypothetical protein HY397_01720 [Candidatus Doudnabacteria bacterium]|nr:hypothetical protein [Candidatus Doudnabacteria bacterium]